MGVLVIKHDVNANDAGNEPISMTTNVARIASRPPERKIISGGMVLLVKKKSQTAAAPVRKHTLVKYYTLVVLARMCVTCSRQREATSLQSAGHRLVTGFLVKLTRFPKGFSSLGFGDSDDQSTTKPRNVPMTSKLRRMKPTLSLIVDPRRG